MPRSVYIITISLLVLAGCARNTDGTWKAPFVYRIDIQQGNVVDQSMINQLKPGMTKEQVRFIMGTPMLIDPFHSYRWEYVYSFEPGDGERQQRHITVFFKDDKLSHVAGDIKVTNNPTVIDEATRDKTVVVPIEDYEEGIFDRAWDTVTFSNDKKNEEEPDSEEVESVESDTYVDETPELEDETPIEKVTDGESETGEEEIAADEEESLAKKEKKGLFARFWDRITAEERDSEQTGEETEQDRRDVEIFEEAGGQF